MKIKLKLRNPQRKKILSYEQNRYFYYKIIPDEQVL